MTKNSQVASTRILSLLIRLDHFTQGTSNAALHAPFRLNEVCQESADSIYELPASDPNILQEQRR